jgi:hypothetical protein
VRMKEDRKEECLLVIKLGWKELISRGDTQRHFSPMKLYWKIGERVHSKRKRNNIPPLPPPFVNRMKDWVSLSRGGLEEFQRINSLSPIFKTTPRICWTPSIFHLEKRTLRFQPSNNYSKHKTMNNLPRMVETKGVNYWSNWTGPLVTRVGVQWAREFKIRCSAKI